MTERFFSYAQNREDYHLALMLSDVTNGFYIDVGGGHVVADNVTAHFYAMGWRGLVVEPQQALARAYAVVRPRDQVIPALLGRAEGEAVFHEVAEFHGLSTTVASNAALSAQHGIASVERRLPVTTLAAICAAHAPGRIDILKIDVEGAEADVIAGNDWTRFRPRIVVVEAVTPWSMADASAAFEPLLLAARYRFVFFDGLNRFYVDEDHADLARRLPAEPADWGMMDHLGEYGPPQENASHPDHALAKVLPNEMLSGLNDCSVAELRAVLPPQWNVADQQTRWSLARIAAFFDGGFVG